jgi:hypothetical protein
LPAEPDAWQARQLISVEIGNTISLVAIEVLPFFPVRRIKGYEFAFPASSVAVIGIPYAAIQS